MFLPTTRNEMKKLGWDRLDIILITGDSYIDSPFIGVAVIGKVLLDSGYRVGIIAQPDISSDRDISRLGEPGLFWGVTAGCIDSMVANRTASGKKRRSDDYTAGGHNNRRPDRAAIVYSNLIRRYFKDTRPIVLGGIEASLRRIAHYDFWTDSIRRSILFDARADYILYGMAERPVLELAEALKKQADPEDIRGLCYISADMPESCIELPSYRESAEDRNAFIKMFHTFYRNNDPETASPLAQKQDTRFLIQNPPAHYLSTSELDRVHDLDYERDVHPFHLKQGRVKALETIRFSITTHRGCYGECSYCAIAVHQGRTVRSRSTKSILAEARQIASHPLFRGTIHDVGGPTANMYGIECETKSEKGSCPNRKCLFPKVCPRLNIDHEKQISLLRSIRHIKGIRNVFVASGIRYDMIMADKNHGKAYLDELISHHISGQMKIAPEHTEEDVLKLMCKPGSDMLLKFKDLFYRLSEKAGKNLFLTYYLIAAHPGCTQAHMKALRSFFLKNIGSMPEQVQVFTPAPSTYSTLMYWTGQNPFNGEPCFAEKTFRGRGKQKSILTDKTLRRPLPHSGLKP